MFDAAVLVRPLPEGYGAWLLELGYSPLTVVHS